MYIDRAAECVGQVETIDGWVYNSRSSGKVTFVLVRDGSGIMQCVVAKSDVDESTFELVRHLAQESSLSISGTIHAENGRLADMRCTPRAFGFIKSLWTILLRQRSTVSTS